MQSSGVPSYVYLAQVNSEWLASTPALSDALDGIQHQLAGFAGAFDARNVIFEPRSIGRVVPGLTFLPNDPVHIRDPAGLGAYIADQLRTLLARRTGSGRR